jgi:hypothetical protein
MLGVTLFGLFLTPVFYTVIGRLTDRTTRRVHHHAPIANAAPAEGH